MSNPTELDSLYTRDPVSSSLWRKIVAASTQYELSLERGDTLQPPEFASQYHDIPPQLLLPELERVQSDCSLNPSPAQPSGTPDLPGERYMELELIGTGGMGEVYRGLDRECQRLVAIKKIRNMHQVHPEAKERFRAEAEMTAGLEHPGIIPVYGQGIDGQGREFYVMRLISGEGSGTLARSIREFHDRWVSAQDQGRHQHRQQLNQLRDLVRRIVDVANTVAYVHHRGIVHRDLKPSNILIGPYGETLIADWGLARKIDSGTPHSVSNDLPDSPDHTNTSSSSRNESTTGVGTPGYAAPELTLGTPPETLRSADIYSLGAMLYNVLTGLSPNATQNLLSCHLNVPAVSSIEAISRKAMATDSSMRYATAEAFREDLLRWIAGEPVSACPEDWWEKVIRWPGRNHTRAAGLASALAIAFVAGTLFLLYQSQQAHRFQIQSGQLQVALEASTTLLEQTQQAQQSAEAAQRLAEQAQQLAEQKEQEATRNRELAEKRGDLAFDGLIRFQDLVVTSQEVFHSAELSSLHDELTGQSKEIFQTILTDLEQEIPPSLGSLKRLCEMTHRLALTESSLGKNDAANTIFDRTCAWMQQRLDAQNPSGSTTQFLLLQLGKLRSFQGTLSMRTGNHQLAKSQLDESIRRLAGILDDDTAPLDHKQQAVSPLACSLSSLSMHQFFAGDIEGAKKLQEQAIARLASTAPETYNDAMVRVQVHGNMSLLYEKASQIDQALAELKLAAEQAEIAGQMISQNPAGFAIGSRGVKPTIEHIQLRSQLASEQSRLLIARQDYTAALDVLRSHLKKDVESLGQLPADPTILQSYQTTATGIQSLLISRGDREGAAELTKAWVKLAEDLAQNNSPTLPSMLFLIIAHHSAGHLNEQFGQTDLAMQNYRDALQDCDQADLQQIRGPAIAYQRVELEMHAFHLQLNTSPWNEVEQCLLRAMQSAEKLVGSAADQVRLLPLARAQLARGLAALRTAQRAEDAAKWETELRTKNLLD